MEESKFYSGHLSKAELNKLCKGGMGSSQVTPTNSPKNLTPQMTPKSLTNKPKTNV